MILEEIRSTKSKKFDITGLVCKSWLDKVQKRTNSLFPGNATSGLHIILRDYQYRRQKFQIVILKIGYFTEQSIKSDQMLGCKIQNDL